MSIEEYLNELAENVRKMQEWEADQRRFKYDFEMTGHQFHEVLDRLWDCLPDSLRSCDGVTTVFDKVLEHVRTLKARLDSANNALASERKAREEAEDKAAGETLRATTIYESNRGLVRDCDIKDQELKAARDRIGSLERDLDRISSEYREARDVIAGQNVSISQLYDQLCRSEEPYAGQCVMVENVPPGRHFVYRGERYLRTQVPPWKDPSRGPIYAVATKGRPCTFEGGVQVMTCD